MGHFWANFLSFELPLRDAVFILNECGAISMRARRGGGVGNGLYVKRSFSTASVVSDLDNCSVAEMAYDPRAHSDSLRLPKNARVLGMAANPTTDCNFAVVTTDGRVILVDLLVDAATAADQSESPLREAIQWEFFWLGF